jgi:hypothetical protein
MVQFLFDVVQVFVLILSQRVTYPFHLLALPALELLALEILHQFLEFLDLIQGLGLIQPELLVFIEEAVDFLLEGLVLSG